MHHSSRKVSNRLDYTPLWIFLVWIGSISVALYLYAASVGSRLRLGAITIKWDGGWYQSIINSGYHLAHSQSSVAFFPLYPLSVWLIHSIGISTDLSGVLLSLSYFLVALITLHQLIKRRYGDQVALISCLLLCFSPFSFFFGLIYTESLFLLLATLTLLAIDEDRYWLAAFTAGAASATRVVGLILGLVVLIAYLRKTGLKTQAVPKFILLGIISISGIIAFMAYQKIALGDALGFIHVQKYWPDRNLGLHGLKLPFTSLAHDGYYSSPFMLALVEIVTVLASLILTIYCYLKVDRLWSIYAGGVLIVVLCSGSLVSINRYGLILFPLYVAAAILLQKQQRYLFVLLPSAMLLAVFVNLFVQTNVFLG